MEVNGYVIPYQRKILLEKIVDSMIDRMETHQLNSQKLFGALESLDYGEILMNHILGVLTDDQREVIFIALSETDCFSDMLKKEYRTKQALEDDIFIWDRDELDDEIDFAQFSLED